MADDNQQQPTGEAPPSEQIVGGTAPQPFAPPPKVDEQSNEVLAARANVKRWQSIIKKDRAHWAKDFERMRDNMNFVFGLQWHGQTNINDEHYTNNVTLRMVKQKEATLYARNPEVEVFTRKRMDFAVWDEQEITIQAAAAHASQLTNPNDPLHQGPQPVPPALIQLFMDYENGQNTKALREKVAKTLTYLCTYDIDAQKPDFKEQMKNMVIDSAIVCGVGYCRVNFVSESKDEGPMRTTEMVDSILDRVKRAQAIVERIEKGEVEMDSAQVQELKSLMASVSASAQLGDEVLDAERIEYDFPLPTAIIPSRSTRALTEWVGTTHIAEEHIVPLEEANAFFGTDIKVGEGEGGAKKYGGEGADQEPIDVAGEKPDPISKPLVCMWTVYDKRTKTRFVLCDGWKDYVLPPEPVIPAVSGFWPIAALTFNQTVVDPQCKASIFPPSDVDLARSPQKERNRTRDALRDHRNASAPAYIVRKGSLSKNDRDALAAREPNQVIELDSIPGDVKPSDFINILQVVPINPSLYDTRPQDEDILYATGSQEANLGPAKPNVTATVGTIAEQSRMTVTSANVDSLDGFLSRIVRMAGEMRLRTASADLVKQLVGIGAVWPEQEREAYIALLLIQIKAASSGKPNQAIAVANFERLAPLLLQAGANPVAVIEEGVRRLDDRLDVTKFFPVATPPLASAVAAAPSANAPSPQAQPSQPLQQGMSEAASPIPLAAA